MHLVTHALSLRRGSGEGTQHERLTSQLWQVHKRVSVNWKQREVERHPYAQAMEEWQAHRNR